MTAEQALANLGAEANASLYGVHRERLTAALLEQLPAGEDARVALLGAGNCHDVDLPTVAERCREIHLVDIDDDALARACRRQPPEVRRKLVRHAPVDLTGAALHEGRWRGAPPTADARATVAAEVVLHLASVLPTALDLVASCCVLTQMHRNAWLTLVPDGALEGREGLVGALTQTINDIHLRSLAALLRPGGTALLATDFLSSLTCPLDNGAPGADLGRLLEQQRAAGNFFFVVDPVALQALLREDEGLSRQVDGVAEPSPWIWQESPRRAYLVYALRFQRRSGSGKNA